MDPHSVTTYPLVLLTNYYNDFSQNVKGYFKGKLFFCFKPFFSVVKLKVWAG